jgi:CheY-like chemotaxis protein
MAANYRYFSNIFRSYTDSAMYSKAAMLCMTYPGENHAKIHVGMFSARSLDGLLGVCKCSTLQVWPYGGHQMPLLSMMWGAIAQEMLVSARIGAEYMHTIRVLLVDANPTFLRIATRLLHEYYSNELTIVGSSDNEDQAIQQAQQEQPRAVLLGLGQHNLTMLQLIPRLRALLPGVVVIVLGTLDIHAYQQAALAAGADAFVAKVAINQELLPTIQSLTSVSHNGVPPDQSRQHSLGEEAPGS